MSEGVGAGAGTPTIILQLPPPPSLNALWSTPPGFRRRVRSPEYSEWILRAGWELRRQVVGCPPIEGSFNATLTVPASSRRDLDNWAKAIFDLCQSCGVVNNDRGLKYFSVSTAPRSDVLVLLWDLGGPALPVAKALRVTSRKGRLAKAITDAQRRFIVARTTGVRRG